MHRHTARRGGCTLHVIGDLKADTADAVVALLEPVQSRYAELAADPGSVDKLLATGRDRAIAFAQPQLDAATRAIGLMS